MMNFFKRSKTLQICAITLCVASLGIFFRLYPVLFNIPRQRLQLSAVAVELNLRKMVMGKIETSMPNAPATTKEQLYKTSMAQILAQEKQNIRKTIKTFAQEQFKNLLSFYLLESDPYYYYYLTQNILAKGSITPVVKNGKYFDALMMAPVGQWRKLEIHPYIGAFLYRIFSFFTQSISLVYTLALAPLLFYLCAIALFTILCSYLSVQKTPLFIAGIFFSLSPIFIQRSSFGWYDTDSYNIIFVFLSLLCLLKTTEKQKSYRWIALLALVNSTYALFWQGWFFLSILSLLSLACIMLLSKKNKRELAQKTALYFLLSAALSILLLSPQGLIDSLKDIFAILKSFFFFDENVWPDIFIMVGELKSPSLFKIIHVAGGYVFFFAGLAAVAMMATGMNKISKEKRIILIVFYTACLLMAKSAERFIIFLIGPLALCFAVGLNHFYCFLKKKMLSVSPAQNRWAHRTVALALSLLISIPLVYGHANARAQLPIFNRVWEEALTKLSLQSPPESIVNSWWPPGHFIKAIAHRAVTFDGATMNTPAAYWMANFFLSQDETEALGTLRMLNNSGNQAYEFLRDNGMDAASAVALLKTIIKEEKNVAGQLLRPLLGQQKTQQLLELTHSQPPPSYCLVYQEMPENALGLYYIKAWDFSKAKTIRKNRGIFWRGSKDNIATLWSISGGSVYIGKESPQISEDANRVFFDNGVELDAAAMEAKIHNLEGALSGIPASVLFIRDNALIEKQSAKPTLNLSVLILEHPSQRRSSIIAPAAILRSLLFRMYFLDGIGLKHFQKVIEEENPFLRTKIILYKTLWETNDK